MQGRWWISSVPVRRSQADFLGAEEASKWGAVRRSQADFLCAGAEEASKWGADLVDVGAKVAAAARRIWSLPAHHG